MKIIIGIVIFLLGFVGASALIFNEKDKKTMWKIIIAALCGALCIAGEIIVIC